MIIKFSWGSGKMSVDAEMLMLEMPMMNFKKWVKLFALYGEPEDHQAFLHLLEDRIYSTEVQIKELEAEVNEFQRKAEGQIFTNLSVRYCREQMRLKQKHLNGAKTRLKRCQSMCNYLKGCLS